MAVNSYFFNMQMFNMQSPFFFFFFFWLHFMTYGNLSSPTRNGTPAPCSGIVTTGSPGKSPSVFFMKLRFAGYRILS